MLKDALNDANKWAKIDALKSYMSLNCIPQASKGHGLQENFLEDGVGGVLYEIRLGLQQWLTLDASQEATETLPVANVFSPAKFPSSGG